MKDHQVFLISVVTAMLSLSSAVADDIRYYQENGITYREVRRTVQRPVCETKMQQSTQTVYKEELYTETKDVTQVVWQPVTTYHAESYWVGRWNPFVEPYLATRWVPDVSWQQKTQVMKMPVTCRRVVPVTQTVQTPVNTQRFVNEEVVVSRTAVGGPAASNTQMAARPISTYSGATGSTYSGAARPTSSGTSNPIYNNAVYSGERIGGISKMNQDPPRYGTNGSWQSSSAR